MSGSTYAHAALLARAERPDALLDGVLVVRWCVVAWLMVLLLSGLAGVPRPLLGWVALLLAGGWTLWLTTARPRWGTPTLLADAVVCGLLLIVAAAAPAVATVYPVAAALTWGARRGLRDGALAGAALGTMFVLAHVVVGQTAGYRVERGRTGRCWRCSATPSASSSPVPGWGWCRRCCNARPRRWPSPRPTGCGPVSRRPGWPSARR